MAHDFLNQPELDFSDPHVQTLEQTLRRALRSQRQLQRTAEHAGIDTTVLQDDSPQLIKANDRYDEHDHYNMARARLGAGARYVLYIYGGVIGDCFDVRVTPVSNNPPASVSCPCP